MFFVTKNKSPKKVSAEVLIVGAGPAGIGVATALKKAGVTDMLVVDAREIGASFLNWPRQMSFLTPSFTQTLSDSLTSIRSTRKHPPPIFFVLSIPKATNMQNT